MRTKYEYHLTDRNRVLDTVTADTLDEALIKFAIDRYQVTHEFHMMAVVENKNGGEFGITWDAIRRVGQIKNNKPQ